VVISVIITAIAYGGATLNMRFCFLKHTHIYGSLFPPLKKSRNYLFYFFIQWRKQASIHIPSSSFRSIRTGRRKPDFTQ